jgi:tetratricopeptide (TPR) repeat protein
MIEDDSVYAAGIEQIAAAYARTGEIDKATETARRLSDSDSALSSVARACPSRDLLTDCMEIARAIEYAELKATALIELAGQARKIKAQDESAELIEEAASAADEIDFPQQRIEARVRIAAWYKDNDQTEQGVEVLSKARTDCEEIDGSDRNAALYQIAAAYAGLREFNTADQLLEEIEDPYEFCHASAAVAVEHYQAGDQNAALKLLADGLEVIKDEPVYGERSLITRRAVLGSLAETYALIGRLEDALQVTELQDSEEQQDSTLAQIAFTSASSDDPNTAFKVFEKIKDDSMRVLARLTWCGPGRSAIVWSSQITCSVARRLKLLRSNGPSNEPDASPNWLKLMNCASSPAGAPKRCSRRSIRRLLSREVIFRRAL